MKQKSILLSALLFSMSMLTSVQVQAEQQVVAQSATTPTKFSSVDAMIEEFNDYSSGRKNTYELISKSPLHIRLSPLNLPGTPEEQMLFEYKRAMVYGVYRTLINTNEDQVTVTVIPADLNMETKAVSLSDKDHVTVTKTKAQALKDISQFIDVNSLDALQKEDDQWSDKFEEIYSNGKQLAELTTVMTSP